MKVEIETVNIKIGKNNLSLTMQEIRELKMVLKELIPDEVTMPYVPIYPSYPIQPFYEATRSSGEFTLEHYHKEYEMEL